LISTTWVERHAAQRLFVTLTGKTIVYGLANQLQTLRLGSTQSLTLSRCRRNGCWFAKKDRARRHEEWQSQVKPTETTGAVLGEGEARRWHDTGVMRRFSCGLMEIISVREELCQGVGRKMPPPSPIRALRFLIEQMPFEPLLPVPRVGAGKFTVGFIQPSARFGDMAKLLMRQG